MIQVEILDESIELLNRGDFDGVIRNISDFLDENPQYKTIDYYHFANPIEEILYSVYIGDVESINVLDLGESLEEVYLIYSIALMNLGKLDEAEKYLKTAKMINPVSAQILMKQCELYQAMHSEKHLKELSLDILKYSYDVNLLISAYFKLADYHYHTGEDMELYGHLLNFYMFLRAGEDMGDVQEDIMYLREHDIQVGFNMEVIQILAYLYDVHSKNGMPNSAEYFKNILGQIGGFQEYLKSLE